MARLYRNLTAQQKWIMRGQPKPTEDGQTKRQLNEIARGSLTDEQERFYREALERHHGEPVRPVSFYCHAFDQWLGALAAKPTREGDARDEVLGKIADMRFQLNLAIHKSNLLWRLIYLGQPLRTKKCPIHEGRWSGYAYPGKECACNVGSDITGWLP